MPTGADDREVVGAVSVIRRGQFRDYLEETAQAAAMFNWSSHLSARRPWRVIAQRRSERLARETDM